MSFVAGSISTEARCRSRQSLTIARPNSTLFHFSKRSSPIEDILIAIVVIVAFGGVIYTVVREMIREEEYGSSGNKWLPREVQKVAGIDPGEALRSPENPEATDPELPSFDAAYADPELLSTLGVDGIVFEESAAQTFKSVGARKRKRKVITGVYARVYALDEAGDYRTLASVDWLDARDVSAALEDQARDLAGRLGVPFQRI